MKTRNEAEIIANRVLAAALGATAAFVVLACIDHHRPAHKASTAQAAQPASAPASTQLASVQHVLVIGHRTRT